MFTDLVKPIFQNKLIVAHKSLIKDRLLKATDFNHESKVDGLLPF